MNTKTAGAALDVRVKMVDFQVKEAGADDGLEEGEFIGYASAFGNKDSDGDIVEDTTFDRTLEEWAKSGDVIPVLWGHDVFDPFNNIGGLKDAVAIKVTEKADGDKPGLKVHGFLDIGDNPTAAQVYRLMKGRRTRKMSFAYAIKDGKQEDDGYHIKDVDLFEVSVVQIPANPEAEILTVKHALGALIKSGRTLSAKNEATLREARDAIDSVLASLGDDDGKAGNPANQEGKASGKATGKVTVSDEDPAKGKSGASTEDPEHAPSVDDDPGVQLFTLELAAYAVGKD